MYNNVYTYIVNVKGQYRYGLLFLLFGEIN
jgi:hypothetical protein